MPHSSCGPSHHLQGSRFWGATCSSCSSIVRKNQSVLIIFKILVIGFRKDALYVLRSQTHSPFPSFVHAFACDLFLIPEAQCSGLSWEVEITSHYPSQGCSVGLHCCIPGWGQVQLTFPWWGWCAVQGPCPVSVVGVRRRRYATGSYNGPSSVRRRAAV